MDVRLLSSKTPTNCGRGFPPYDMQVWPLVLSQVQLQLFDRALGANALAPL